MPENKKMSVKRINALIKYRKGLLDALPEDEWTSEDIDAVEDLIRDNIIEHFDKFEVDFILETLTQFGDAPSLVYDDNGLFAVSSRGYQPVVIDDNRIDHITVFTDYDDWQPTIREALWRYLTYEA